MNREEKAVICTQCEHELDCERWGSKPYLGRCRDFMGKIIVKGLLYHCTCGFTDAIVEKDDGALTCTNCGAYISRKQIHDDHVESVIQRRKSVNVKECDSEL